MTPKITGPKRGKLSRGPVRTHRCFHCLAQSEPPDLIQPFAGDGNVEPDDVEVNALDRVTIEPHTIYGSLYYNPSRDNTCLYRQSLMTVIEYLLG